MIKKILAIVIIALGVANMALGITFITIGQTKANFLSSTMRDEKITLTLSDAQIAAGDYIDTAAEAQAAGDLVRSHRHAMGTYDEVLGGQKFDPTQPAELTYAQALNLENYLYLAVASFGLTTVAIGAGVGMLLAGIAFVIAGALVVVWKRRKAVPSVS